MKTSPREEDTSATAYRVTHQVYETREVETLYVDETTGERKKTSKLMLVEKTAPIGKFMQQYREKLQYFCFHNQMAKWTWMVRKDRAAIRKGDLSLIMDYSEKLNRLRRTKIQTEHWVNTAITIEVAVAEGFKATIPADDPVLARLSSMSPEERGKELDSLGVLEKQIYYHCSDYKEQEAKVTTHNMRVMLDELLQANVLLDGGTVWLKTDGCAKQYKCSKAMYLLCKLVADLRAEGKRVTIDQMLEVTGHGKDEADGHGGVFKNWLTGEMMRSDFMEGDESVVASSDAREGEALSFADACAKRAREGFGDLKPAGMNSKRREKSNTAKRHVRTYGEDDIRDAPAMKEMTAALAADAEEGEDSRIKATLGHNNFRADPDLQKDGKYIIAARRLGCLCDGCRRALARPIATRYKPHDDCVHAAAFGRDNDWKLCELVSKDGASEELIEEDAQLQLEARTDGVVSGLVAGENIAFATADEVYYARALGPAYRLDADVELEELEGGDGKAIQLEKGSIVIDAWYYNKVPGVSNWMTPFEEGAAGGRVRIPSHLILHAGFAMPLAVAPARPRSAAGKKKKKKAWGVPEAKAEAVAKGAVVVSAEVRAACVEELSRRDE